MLQSLSHHLLYITSFLGGYDSFLGQDGYPSAISKHCTVSGPKWMDGGRDGWIAVEWADFSLQLEAA